MSVLYCRHCGAKIEYDLNKPSVCHKCNKEISPSVSSQDKQTEVTNLGKNKIKVTAENVGEGIPIIHRF